MHVSFSHGNEVGDARLIGVIGVVGVAGLFSDIIDDLLPMLPHNRGVLAMVVDEGDVGSSGSLGLGLFPMPLPPTPAA